MKNLVHISIIFIALSGCSDVRTESTDVAHLDYVNRVFYVAQQSAVKAGCYDFDNASAEQDVCVKNEIDKTVKAVGKSQFNRSQKIVSQLEEEGKVAKTDDGMNWYFITARESY